MNTKILISVSSIILGAFLVKPIPNLNFFGQSTIVLAQTTQDQIVTRLYQKASPAVITIKNGKAMGSGFVVSADGLIITNAHVVEDGPTVVTVKFSDGRQVSADVIGFAKGGVDLAVLRVYNQKKLPFLPLANPKSIKVGESVFAIGSPLGLENTLTQGIISRLDPKEGIIQHSANINHGNSGGPLLNGQGQVIGVNFSGNSDSPVYDSNGNTIGSTSSGFNFAISIDILQTFVRAVQKGDISSVSTLNQKNQAQQPVFELALNGQSIQGELSKNGARNNNGWYYNIYKFPGTAGENVAIQMNSQQFEPKITLYQVINEGQWQEIQKSVQRDLGPGDFNAEIAIQLPADGIYAIIVTSTEHEASGKYILKATTAR